MSTAKPKVLQVVWSLEVGGMERVVLHLAKGLPAQGFATEMATLAGEAAPPGLAPDGLTLWELSKGPGLDLRLARSLAAMARQTGADILHAHNTLSLLYAVLAGFLARKPVLATLHGANYEGPARHRRLRRWLARRSSAVACVSQDALAAARDVDRIAPKRLRLVYNGIDLSEIAAAAPDRQAVRGELGLGPGQAAIISVGRLSPEKDYATLLAAVRELGDRGDAPCLLLVGDGPEKARLEQRAQELGLGEAARFLGARADVPRLLAASDVFALSSLSEGVSMALLEAMAAKLPVVATQVGGNPEVVLPGETGLLVPPGDPLALARGLAQILDGPSQAQAMGRAGAARVEDKFSLAAMCRAYAELYREAMA